MKPKPTIGDRLLSTSECIKRLHINRSEWAREVASSVTLRLGQETRNRGFYYREAAFDYYLAHERVRYRRTKKPARGEKAA